VEKDWALSFIIPGAIIATVGVIFFFTLVVRPEDVGLELDEYVPVIVHSFQKTFCDQHRHQDVTRTLDDYIIRPRDGLELHLA
jgi:sugar phosphate permease